MSFDQVSEDFSSLNYVDQRVKVDRKRFEEMLKGQFPTDNNMRLFVTLGALKHAFSLFISFMYRKIM